MEPVDLHRNPVQTFIDGNVERFAFVADAETDVAGDALGLLGARLRDACGDETELLAGRVDDEDAGPLEAPGGEVDVALHVHGHAVRAVLLAEIDDCLSLSID